jgi:hypothetical protein
MALPNLLHYYYFYFFSNNDPSTTISNHTIIFSTYTSLSFTRHTRSATLTSTRRTPHTRWGGWCCASLSVSVRAPSQGMSAPFREPHRPVSVLDRSLDASAGLSAHSGRASPARSHLSRAGARASTWARGQHARDHVRRALLAEHSGFSSFPVLGRYFLIKDFKD